MVVFVGVRVINFDVCEEQLKSARKLNSSLEAVKISDLSRSANVSSVIFRNLVIYLQWTR